MRLTGLEVHGFRAFAGIQRLDLDADAIIVVGPNGQGKTSLFDSVLWALTGSVPRLGEGRGNIVSMYSSSGEARVSLELRSSGGETFHVVRRFDGQEQHIQLEVQNQVLVGDEARVRLVKEMWPEALATSDSVAALTAAITRSVYLQQDLVRQFIEADTERERFGAVSELVGAGRVTDFQQQLDRAKTAWSRATNARAREGEVIRQRLAALLEQLSALDRTAIDDSTGVDRRWTAWWKTAQAQGVDIRAPVPGSTDAPTALDTAMRQLQSLLRATERREGRVAELLSEFGKRPVMPRTDEATLRNAVVLAQRNLEIARKELVSAETRAAEIRRAQVVERERRAELRTLAELALRHLDDQCPVCQQAYDRIATRRRLKQIASGSMESAIERDRAPDVAALAARVSECEKARVEADARLRQAEHMQREYEAWVLQMTGRLSELNLETGLGPEAINRLRAMSEAVGATKASISHLQEEGERLALALGRAAERARKAELEQEAGSVRKEVEELDRFLVSREETGALAGQVLEGLREATSVVVQARLERLEPVLQRIYARIDPHPAFRSVRFRAWLSYGRGHMATSVSDPVAELSTDSPEVVLSSSQMNGLAVSVFLAFNLGMSSIPLSVAMLDDPLQSLDDVNLLGLIDLLRRTRERRQLVISTHDSRFARLLARKLRPVRTNQRTVVIECEGWSREGPEVTQREVPRDRSPLRIVA
jgi:DNA repair exonuclease SbcCD ATPase subunit